MFYEEIDDMCTAMTLQSAERENFFGRTMDFSYPIEPELYIIPENYQWTSRFTSRRYTNRYRFIAIGQETDGILSFFDGVNQHGFSAAVLYFEGYANFDLPMDGKEPIASLDFLHFILSQCSSVNDLEELLNNSRILGVADPVTERVAPLHWICTDRSGQSVVIEQTNAGLEIISNPIGVMTNSPNFSWHLTNLRNYHGLSTTQRAEAVWGNMTLTPFGQGAGTADLPGSFTSPDRFIRTAFLKSHTVLPESRSEAIMSFFHIMKSVFIPKGVVISSRETYDYTKYIALINTETCTYYFNSYENNQMTAASLWDYQTYGTEPLLLGSIIHPFIV